MTPAGFGTVFAIGAISGTSMDGIDVALLDTDGDRELRHRVEELEGAATASAPEPDDDAGDLDQVWATAGSPQQDEVETPFAWTAPEDAGDVPAPEPSAAAYFARMLAWEPGAGAAEGRPAPMGDA